MFTHVMVGTADLGRAKAFYDPLLAVLGIAPGTVDRHRVLYEAGGGVFGVTLPVNGQPASVGNGGTVGFACASPAQADAWYAAGIRAGGTPCEDPPGLRFGNRYLAYLRDPDGNKVCVMYRLSEAELAQAAPSRS